MWIGHNLWAYNIMNLYRLIDEIKHIFVLVAYVQNYFQYSS